jgi:hypothetical protein
MTGDARPDTRRRRHSPCSPASLDHIEPCRDNRQRSCAGGIDWALAEDAKRRCASSKTRCQRPSEDPLTDKHKDAITLSTNLSTALINASVMEVTIEGLKIKLRDKRSQLVLWSVAECRNLGPARHIPELLSTSTTLPSRKPQRPDESSRSQGYWFCLLEKGTLPSVLQLWPSPRRRRGRNERVIKEMDTIQEFPLSKQRIKPINTGALARPPNNHVNSTILP